MTAHRYSPLLLTLLLPLLSGCGGEGFEPVDAGEVVSFSVSERIPALREKTATKAPKVYTGATADVQALDFAVWAYNMPSAGSLPADWRLDGGTGSTPVKASYNSEKNDWRPAGNIKYNSSSRAATWQARWFALGPWAACNGSTANVSGLTPADGSAPAPRYTVPSGSLVSTRHYDLLAAVSADRAVGTTTPVALNFCHVLTGIRFKREKDLNITDITVSGVYDRADLAMEKIPADGDLTAFVNVDNEGDDADLWSGRTRSVAAPSFSMAPASWTNGRPGNPAAETQWDYAAGDGDIMMMIPQFTPAGATITVTIDGVEVSGDISGHRWLPGRLVTYAITRGDDFLTWELSALGEDIIWENEYIFEGTVPATLTYPAEGGELTLATDFRSCIEDGEQTVPESFVFQYSADGTGDWTDGLPDWLSSPGTSLDGAATATTLSLTASAQSAWSFGRSIYVRILQTNSGKTTSSCKLTQDFIGFKVDAKGRKVMFAHGNVVVDDTLNGNGTHTLTWRFADHQWEHYPNLPPTSPGQTSTYSLFGWGTGNNPWLTSTNNRDYSTFTDWGVNFGTAWRTPTRDEWKYLHFDRPGAEDLWAFGTIVDDIEEAHHGLIYLPDNWVLPAGVTFRPGANNVYTYDGSHDGDWLLMEEHGAVFLPLTGSRYNSTDFHHLDDGGMYWSSTLYSSLGLSAYMANFTTMLAGYHYTTLSNAIAVRLVYDSN